MRRPLLASSLTLGVLLSFACGAPHTPTAPTGSSSSTVGRKAVEVTLASVGLDAAVMDRSADPCTDFYRFACGGWLDHTSIPEDKPGVLRGIDTITDRNEIELHAIAEDARAGAIATPAGKKVGAYYAACTDLDAIEAAGLGPIEPLRSAIRGAHDAKSLARVVGELHDADVGVFFSFSDGQDFDDARKVIGEVDQGGLGLPERDFYLRGDDKSKELLVRYSEHIVKLTTLAGADEKTAKLIADDVVRIETTLAKSSKTGAERRDVKGLHNKVDRAGLVGRTKGFPWASYLGARGQEAVKDINVTSLPFLAGLDAVLDKEKADAVKRYLDWHVLTAMASALPKRFDEERFRFVRLLTGQEKQSARWKRCLVSTDSAMGELLAEPYLARRFDAESKAAAEEMIGAVRAEFRDNLASLPWMDDVTKKRAATKLEAITFQIGYPAKSKTYDFAVDPKSHAANVLASRKWEARRHLAKIGKPVDRTDWFMTPSQVDAYADPQKVLMVFPAGILQAPIFGKSFSPAVNLGGIGMVIGHELTHHFDDQGAELSATGDVASWWSPEVKTKFDAKGACVVDQYSGYEAVPGVKLDGKRTLGENIADIGGLKMAYGAYRRLRAGARETQIAEGLTEDQQFFLAFGQSWCTVMRDEMARTMAQTDEHSLPKYRVIGALSNSPAFARAFNCAEGTPMHPKNACEVWLSRRRFARRGGVGFTTDTVPPPGRPV